MKTWQILKVEAFSDLKDGTPVGVNLGIKAACIPEWSDDYSNRYYDWERFLDTIVRVSKDFGVKCQIDNIPITVDMTFGTGKVNESRGSALSISLPLSLFIIDDREKNYEAWLDAVDKQTETACELDTRCLGDRSQENRWVRNAISFCVDQTKLVSVLKSASSNTEGIEMQEVKEFSSSPRPIM